MVALQGEAVAALAVHVGAGFHVFFAELQLAELHVGEAGIIGGGAFVDFG